MMCTAKVGALVALLSLSFGCRSSRGRSQTLLRAEHDSTAQVDTRLQTQTQESGQIVEEWEQQEELWAGPSLDSLRSVKAVRRVSRRRGIRRAQHGWGKVEVETVHAEKEAVGRHVHEVRHRASSPQGVWRVVVWWSRLIALLVAAGWIYRTWRRHG